MPTQAVGLYEQLSLLYFSLNTSSIVMFVYKVYNFVIVGFWMSIWMNNLDMQGEHILKLDVDECNPYTERKNYHKDS